MAKVRQMIEWFKTLPPEAIVEVGDEVTKGYQTYMEMKQVDIDMCDILDYSSGEDREMYPNMDGKIFVQLKSM